MVKTICWSSNQAQNGEERRLWTWHGCWCQTGWFEYFRNCWSTGIFTHNHLQGLQRMVRKRENIRWAADLWVKRPYWCKRRMVTLVGADRKATVTHITTHYSRGMQKSISERITCRTLKQMGYSSRRPHRVTLRLQWAQAHQNWTIEDWKNIAWSDESQFLLWHSDGRVRLSRIQHESMDPSCLVSAVQAAAGGVMVWEIFSWHTLCQLRVI